MKLGNLGINIFVRNSLGNIVRSSVCSNGTRYPINLKGLRYASCEKITPLTIPNLNLENINLILSVSPQGELCSSHAHTLFEYVKSRLNRFPKEHPYFSTLKSSLKKLKNVSVDDSSKLVDYSSTPYNMPLKFMVSTNEHFLKSGTSLIVDEVPNMFKGIDLKCISKAFDNLENYLDKNKINVFKIAGKACKAEYIGAGEIGKTYKISDLNGSSSVAIKYFKDPLLTGYNCAYSEIPIAREASKAGVVDVAKFYMANPCGRYTTFDGISESGITGGWQMMEFIEESTPIKNNGVGYKLADWLKSHGLRLGDINSGSKKGNYIVDVGGVIQHNGLCDTSFAGSPSFADNLLAGFIKNENLEKILNLFQ